LRLVSAVSAAAVLALIAITSLPHPAPAVADAPVGLVARGDYLVGDAGQCRDCHGSNLQGGPAPKGPPGVPWATNAPKIAGLPMFQNDADAVQFLRTAVLPTGHNALPPMPHYNFHREDAEAIVAYLRSLK
jgi:mono/diheme cytochrome c family protein